MVTTVMVYEIKTDQPTRVSKHVSTVVSNITRQ